MEAMELGVALLWSGDFEGAWDHYHSIALAQPRHMSVIYEMAGVAKWCLERPSDAVREWKDGLRCEYLDAAGGVREPLLLYAASCLRPGICDQREARRLLTTRANNPLVHQYRNWPGPIAEFVLGRIDEARLRLECQGTNEGDTRSCHLLADFYVSLVEYTNGNTSAFETECRKAAAVDWGTFDSDNDLFFTLAWKPEFHIARHEASVLGVA